MIIAIMIIMIIIIIITIDVIISIIFLFIHRHASSPCITILYNGGSEAPLRLSRRGRSCLVYTRPGIFRLGKMPKEIQSRLFNPVSN